MNKQTFSHNPPSYQPFLFSKLTFLLLLFVMFCGATQAQNYTITTTATTIEITDISDNGETIAISENSGIQFNVTGRTYSLNGGSATSFPVSVSLSGVMAITVNAAGGNDIINVAAFTANLPSLTINGGTGNETVNMNGDITFAAGANLNLDLQDDDAVPGNDVFVMATNTNLILSGTGEAIIKVSQSVTLNTGASIETVDGNILVEANQQATPTTGAFSGVTVTGALSKLGCTGTGTLTVNGTGGNSGSLYGVVVQTGSKIIGGTGAVSVMGTGGSSTSNSNYGVYVNAASSAITSSGGNVSVTGTGGGSGSGGTNHAIYVNAGATISAGSGGTVTVVGNGSPLTTGFTNYGVYVTGASSAITSTDGNVSVTGTGGGALGTTAGLNQGVLVNAGATISAGSNGTVIVEGTGGNGSYGQSHGVNVTGTSSAITSAGGNVSVTGTGGGTGSSNDDNGIYVYNSATVSAGSNGTVTMVGTGGTGSGGGSAGVLVSTSSFITSSGGNVSVTGTGGSGTSGSYDGVYVYSASIISAGSGGNVTVVGNGGNGAGGSNTGVKISFSSSRITSTDGNVSVTGTGGGMGAYNEGVIVGSSCQITAGGSGTVTVLGNGAINTSGVQNYGVDVASGGSEITSSGGNVSVTGTGGGTGSSSSNFGILVSGNGKISAGGSGSVTVVGTGGSGSGNTSHYGISLSSNNAITSSGGNVNVTGTEGTGSMGLYINGYITTATNGGDITVNAKSMQIVSGGISANAASSVTLNPTDNIQINLGTTAKTSGGPFSLSNTEFGLVTGGTLNIGNANSGTITISSSIAHANSDINLVSGGDILIDGGGISTTSGTLLLDCGTSPAAVKPTFTGTDVTCSTLSFGSDLAIVINGTTVNTNYTQLNVAGIVDLTGVDLILSGTPSPALTGGETFTIVNNDGADAIIGTFTGLAEGATISNFLGTVGINATISYLGVGGTGNDVLLTVAAALPVELISFTAQMVKEDVLLIWRTASELNNEGFHLERSMDGAKWEMFGFVPGQGTTQAEQSYSFVDERPLPGTNYYRLKQIDFDGKFEYSNIRSVDFRNLQDFRNLAVYPNPVAHGKLTLYIPDNYNETSTLRIYSQNGQLLRQEIVYPGSNLLDVSGMAPGIYLLEVVNRAGVWQERLIVQKP